MHLSQWVCEDKINKYWLTGWMGIRYSEPASHNPRMPGDGNGVRVIRALSTITKGLDFSVAQAHLDAALCTQGLLLSGSRCEQLIRRPKRSMLRIWEEPI